MSAAYVVVVAGAGCYRRRQGRGRMPLQEAVLLLDAVYLAVVTTPGGGPRSPLVVLFSVQLVAVTLLVSERAGLGMALWDSVLLVLVLVPALSLSNRITSFLGVGAVAAPPAAATALAIVGLWLVAVCTAGFSSIRERQVRRARADLEALAGMAARLGETLSEAEIITLLLQTLVDGSPFRRGAVWWTRLDRPEGLARAGPGERIRPVQAGWRPQPDQVGAAAWAARQALVRPRLDPALDPVAAALLPAARDVVVLPLVMGGVTDALGRQPGLAGITVASGVATLPANASSVTALIAAADEAMGESKRAAVTGCRLGAPVPVGPGGPARLALTGRPAGRPT